MGSRGVLVASDRQEEWLLPWWWEAYAAQNAYPVKFIDWGMSKEAKAWCKQRGEVIDLPLDGEFARSCAQPGPHIQRLMDEHQLLFLLQIRPYWFSKPHVMCAYGWETTLWLDLDCEVLSSLEELFAYAETPSGVAVARDTELSQQRNWELGMQAPGEILYNSGVIAYKRGAPLMRDWAELCASRHREFFGDQNALSHLIHRGEYRVEELPEEFNWRISRGLHFSARIVHWAGSWGKAFIRKHGGLRPFLKSTALGSATLREANSCKGASARSLDRLPGGDFD